VLENKIFDRKKPLNEKRQELISGEAQSNAGYDFLFNRNQ
jgi:hypothetical protein